MTGSERVRRVGLRRAGSAHLSALETGCVALPGWVSVREGRGGSLARDLVCGDWIRWREDVRVCGVV